MPSVRTAADLADLRTETLAAQKAKPVWITVCTGTGCCAYGAEGLADGFEREIDKRGLGRQVGLRRTGCHGFCERGPLVVIEPKGICYLHAQAKDIPTIMDKTVLGDEVVTRLLYLDEETGKRVRTAAEIPFYKHQKRILLENNVLIEATSILDYIGVGGYSALAKALKHHEGEQQEEITQHLRAQTAGRIDQRRKHRTDHESRFGIPAAKRGQGVESKQNGGRKRNIQRQQPPQSPGAIYGGQQDVTQPLVGDPWGTVGGKGVRVRGGPVACGEDRGAHLEVPPNVGVHPKIAQRHVNAAYQQECQHGRKGEHRPEKRCSSGPGTCARLGNSVRNGHARLPALCGCLTSHEGRTQSTLDLLSTRH